MDETDVILQNIDKFFEVDKLKAEIAQLTVELEKTTDGYIAKVDKLRDENFSLTAANKILEDGLKAICGRCKLEIRTRWH